MDQATRTDIAAAAAAHRELGSAYDDAVAESLIDRIGAEIDKRVEAKLGTRPESARPSAQAAQTTPQARPGAAALTGAALGAGITGVLALVADHGSKHMLALILVIWGIIAIIALATAAANRYRNAVRR